MAFSVRLFKFSKRNNSTARPSGGTSFQCTIKAESGILSPELLIDFGGAAAFSDFNYAYIPDFDRYYWISEMVNMGPVWDLRLKCDALASWRDTIGATSLYVLRASAESDGNIFDTYYPAKSDSSTTVVTGTNPFSGSSGGISGGVFICGIVSKAATVGCITYKAISSGGFSSLCTALLDDSLLENSGYTANDASIALQKSIADPLQYIKTCVWLPISEAQIPGTSQLGLSVWNWSIPAVPNTNVSMAQGYNIYTVTLDIPKHPQASRGAYLNTSPYSNYWINIPPFGVIQIDSSLVKSASTLTCRICLDFITGIGTLYVYAGSVLLNKIEAQVGVPINMSQVTRDYLSAATTTVSTAAETIQNAIFGNWAGAVSGAASGIESATKAMTPRVQSTGGNGGFSGLYGDPQLFAQFFSIADEDLAHNGRPLCKIRTPAALGGFMTVLDGDISAPATDAELSEIRSYLEGGFYYE